MFQKEVNNLRTTGQRRVIVRKVEGEMAKDKDVKIQ